MVRGFRRERPVGALRQGAGRHLHDAAELPALRRDVRAGLQRNAGSGDLRLHRRLHEQLRERRRGELRHGLRVPGRHRPARPGAWRQLRRHRRRHVGYLRRLPQHLRLLAQLRLHRLGLLRLPGLGRVQPLVRALLGWRRMVGRGTRLRRGLRARHGLRRCMALGLPPVGLARRQRLVEQPLERRVSPRLGHGRNRLQPRRRRR